jgi:hypothetical protein
MFERSRRAPQPFGPDREEVIVMSALEAIIFAGAAGFAFGLAMVILVSRGIHHEERRMSFLNKRAPSPAAKLARILLGRVVLSQYSDPNGDHEDLRQDPVGPYDYH